MSTILYRIILCAALCLSSNLLAQKPIATLDLDFENAVAMMPPPPDEVKGQIETVRETGLRSIRLALFADKKRVAVPLIQIKGDMAALNETLNDPTSPLRIIATPVGDEGLYQLPTSEKDPLQLQLHKSADALVFAPVGMAEAMRAAGTSAAPIERRPDHVAIAHVNVPTELGLEWVEPLFSQNNGTLSEDDKEGMGMMLGFMTPMFEKLLEPIATADQMSAGLFKLPNGYRVLDYHHNFKDAAGAKAAADVFNGDAKGESRLAKGITRAKKRVERSRAVPEGNLLRTRMVWPASDDEKVMQSLQRDVLGSLMPRGDRPMPSPGPVPTTATEEPLPFEPEGYDPMKLAAEIKAQLDDYIWPRNGSQGYEETFVKDVVVDRMWIANAFMAEGKQQMVSLTSEDGTNVAEPWPKPMTTRFYAGDFGPGEIRLLGKGKAVDCTEASVTMQLNVPLWIERVEIPMGTAEFAEVKSGNATVLVNQLANDLASIQVENEAHRLTGMQAIDADGKTLKSKRVSWGKSARTSRFSGTIKTLYVYVAGPSAPIDPFPVTFSLDRDRQKEQQRVRYLNNMPQRSLPIDKSAFDDLKVGPFGLDLPSPGVVCKPSVSLVGFGPKGKVKVYGSAQQRDAKINVNKSWSGGDVGLFHGTLTLEVETGGEYVQVEKTADGEAVPFSALGGQGSVTFEGTKTTVKSPEQGTFEMIAAYDAEGRPLNRSYAGIPVKVLLKGGTESFTKTYPIHEEEEGETYDKAAFEAYLAEQKKAEK